MIDQLLQGLEKNQRFFDAYPLLFAAPDELPSSALDILTAVLPGRTRSSTWIEDLVSFVPDQQLPGLFEVTWDELQTEPTNEAALGVWSHLICQCPALFHSHLETIQQQRLYFEGYAFCYPWRESESRDLDRLEQLLKENPTCQETRRLLLETRTPRGRDMVRELCGLSQLELEEETMEVGFQGHRQLYPDRCQHLNFPNSILPAEQPLHLQRHHPTWNLPSQATTEFGGDGSHRCEVCGQQGHRWLALEGLELETCHSCLGWSVGELFYQHSETGVARPYGPLDPQEPDFPAAPFPKVTVGLAPTPARWFWQDHATTNSRQNLHRVGGFPTWVQGADHPRCPKCQELMSFRMQLDSDLLDQQGNEILWGDGGACMAFLCRSCRISGFRWQGY